jgi:hypothetical protein
MKTNLLESSVTGRTLALAGLVVAGLLAGAPRAQATIPPEPIRGDTFLITGQELTGETRTVDGDGSVRTVVQTGFYGLLSHIEGTDRALAHALVTMAIAVNGDELRQAEVTYTQFGRGGFTVTIEIDPCWFEYVNERDATAAEFGDDVVVRIETSAAPHTLDPAVRGWLVQRLAFLGAKTAEPYVKGGITLVSPRR